MSNIQDLLEGKTGNAGDVLATYSGRNGWSPVTDRDLLCEFLDDMIVYNPGLREQLARFLSTKDRYEEEDYDR
jgi:hypothetical protein